ncbi:MAG: serine/threonine-protein kinase [Planctomycetota bacterium]
MSAFKAPSERAKLDSTLTADGPSLELIDGERLSSKLIGGRFRLVRQLGSGGSGVVFEALDEVLQERVAVKILRKARERDAPRIAREIAALRRLRRAQFPGVVRLLTEGKQDGFAYIVMELVDGSPFPGRATPTTWEEIAAPTRELCLALSRVHAAGIVHRDLKPINILVTAEAKPIILDFGLSTGSQLGERITDTGQILGTRDYLAPEQILGEPTDARTDLYSLGVMLYEVLSGRLPHSSLDLRERTHRPPIPLDQVAPQVPPAVLAIVDSLLSPRPQDRPASAAHVLLRLEDERAVLPALDLRRVSDSGELERIRGAIRAGVAIDVVGSAGVGKTRLLTDAAKYATRLGCEVKWAVAASRPFASLESILGKPSSTPDTNLQIVRDSAIERVRSQLRLGTVILADDADGLDSASRQILDDCRHIGCVVRTFVEFAAPDIVLKPLSELALREIFVGPDLVLHLREDSARELFRRSSGLPARVREELHAWTSAGIAQREGDRYRVDRNALNRLRSGLDFAGFPYRIARSTLALSGSLLHALAWIQLAGPNARVGILATASGMQLWELQAHIEELEQLGAVRRLEDDLVEPIAGCSGLESWTLAARTEGHLAIARLLEVGTNGRLQHLIAAGDDAEIVKETLRVASHLAQSGHTGEASEAVAEGLISARNLEDKSSETELLRLWVRIAFDELSTRGLARLGRELNRSEVDPVALEPLLRLVEGARCACQGDPDGARAALGSLDLQDWHDLKPLRYAAEIKACDSRPAAELEAMLARIEAEPESQNTPRMRANLDMWHAKLGYRRGEFSQAAERLVRAAACEERLAPRIGAQLNAAAALLEVGDFAKCREIVSQAFATAEKNRLLLLEARALWLRRALDYRENHLLSPKLDFVAAARLLDQPLLLAQICLTESAIAWRSNERLQGEELAVQAQHIWQKHHLDAPAMLAAALARVCRSPAPESRDADKIEVVAALAERAHASLAIQIAALWVKSGAVRASSALPLIEQLAARVDPSTWTMRREVLSMDEAFAICTGRVSDT